MLSARELAISGLGEEHLDGCQGFSRKLSIAILMITLLSCNQFAIAQYEPLRVQMESMDAVAIASLVAGTQTDDAAEFELLKIVRGHDLIQLNQKVRVNCIGKNLEGTQFLIMGSRNPELLWSTPLPASEKAIAYFDAILQLPTDPAKRLEFYLAYLENEERFIARDAFTELASASYEQWVKLKPKLNREKLIEWISDAKISRFRKDLYYTLLGICGLAGDRKLIETMMRSDDPQTRNCLSAMMICYVSLCGDGGLNLMDEQITKNGDCNFSSLHSFWRALRFLGGSEGIVSEERVAESLQLILKHRNSIEVADEVIYYLMRREDWSQLDRVVEIFKSADEDHRSVRRAIFHYLRVCPKPETVALIEELKEIDPNTFRISLKQFRNIDLQKRSLENNHSWDLWDMFAPTSRDWDIYD